MSDGINKETVMRLADDCAARIKAAHDESDRVQILRETILDAMGIAAHEAVESTVKAAKDRGLI